MTVIVVNKHLKNNPLRTFSLCYICIVLVAGFVITTVYANEIKREKASYILSLEEDAQNTLNYFSQSLVAGVNTCNGVFLSQWYTHYRNSAKVYESEFDVIKKMEIQDDITSKAAALAYVSDILIITPRQDSVISRHGWFTIEDYCMIYGMVNIDQPEDPDSMPIISAGNSSICVITLKDTTSRLIQGLICILIDKELFADSFNKILPDSVVYARAEINGQLLFEAGQSGEADIVNTTSMNVPQFSITLHSPSYEQSLLTTHTKNYIMIMIIVLLAGAILAGFITTIVFRPLRGIIKRLGGDFHEIDDPYFFLTEYVEAFSEKNEQLSMENENLDRSMSRFMSLMRDEILFGMLTNPDFVFDRNHTKTTIPWINEGYPYVLAILESKFQDEADTLSSPALNELSQLALHSCTFSILNNDFCILFWFKDMASAKKQHEQIRKKLDENAGKLHHISVSDILTDPQKMGQIYLQQKSEIAGLIKSQFDLPLSFQIELADILQQNKQNECMEFLSRCKNRYNTDAVMQLLTRIASKYNIESAKAMNSYNKCKANNDQDNKWDVLIAFASSLCNSIYSIKHDSINDTVEIICKYIDENYCDPNLGVKQLSDYFSMHRTLISKILKASLGITFSDYLLRLRIERSMELLENTDMSINMIGESVGYINYITFKRAFVRYHGLSPREYRIDCMKSNSVTEN